MCCTASDWDSSEGLSGQWLSSPLYQMQANWEQRCVVTFSLVRKSRLELCQDPFNIPSYLNPHPVFTRKQVYFNSIRLFSYFMLYNIYYSTSKCVQSKMCLIFVLVNQIHP